MSKSRYESKFGKRNPILERKKAKREQMQANLNGIPVIQSEQEKMQYQVSVRYQTALQVLGHLAAIDFSRAIQKATQELDIIGGPKEDQKEMQISIAPQHVAMMAAQYADCLLIGFGFLPPPQQQSIVQE